MKSTTGTLRALLKAGEFLYLPAVYDPLGARLVESVGFTATYVGGFVTGASLTITEPLLTMTEQVDVARAVAESVKIPVLADAGAGFGEPLHTMRTVREFIEAGIAGVHIEDQLYPKRAHYHKYVVHTTTADEFVQKIRFACRARDEADPDFVIIARTDTCRDLGLEEATARVNRAGEVGADIGMLFPRNREETERAPRMCNIPLLYAQSRGNRDGKPIFSQQELKDMGYVAGIDAQIVLLSAFHFQKQALTEMKTAGRWSAVSDADIITTRKYIEDLIGLDEYYAVEALTVEQH